jgi:hypothetical protein
MGHFTLGAKSRMIMTIVWRDQSIAATFVLLVGCAT